MKDEFIKHTYNDNFKKQYKYLLKTIDNYELKFNKDLKDFNEKECSLLLENLSYYQIKTVLIFIKKYKEYCDALNIGTYSVDWNDERLQIDNYKYKIKSKIIKKEDYNNIIKSLSIGDDTSLYFKAIFMFIYEGVPKYGEWFKDLFLLKENDISGTQVKTSSNRVVTISYELTEVLQKVSKIKYITPHNRITELSKVYSRSLFYFPGSNANSNNPSVQEIKRGQQALSIAFKRFMFYKYNISISLNDVLKSYLVNGFCDIAKKYISSDSIIKTNLWDKSTLNNAENFLKSNGYNSGVLHFIRLNEVNIIDCVKSS